MAQGVVRRVFLSYTSELAEYPRNAMSWVSAAKEAVERAGALPVEMGRFTAADQPPAQLCRDRVRECDVYVGIIGFRYGTPVRDDPDRSYVELEFDAASGIRRLIFLIDEDTSMPRAFFADVDHTRSERQVAFRERLDASPVIRAVAISPEQLQTLVLQALNELERQAVSATGRGVERTPTASPPPCSSPTAPRRTSAQGISSGRTAAAASSARAWG